MAQAPRLRTDASTTPEEVEKEAAKTGSLLQSHLLEREEPVFRVKPIDWSQLRKSYRGRLPHWELPGMTAFVTFRQADSLPPRVLAAYRVARRILEKELARDPKNVELRRERVRLFATRIDRCLDSGYGSCLLGDARLATCMIETIGRGDGERYVVHAAVVMPNHVHVVLTLAPDTRLRSITHSWKSFTGHKAVEWLSADVPFWQDESFDHIVRDQWELERFVRYTLANPAKAGFVDWPYVMRGSNQGPEES